MSKTMIKQFIQNNFATIATSYITSNQRFRKEGYMRNKTKRRGRKLDLATDSGTTHVFIASSLPGQKFTSVVLLARETTFIDGGASRE